MKDNYSLFYSYQTMGDVLIVIFDNEKKATSHERKGNVEVIYNNDEAIGYNIFNVQNFLKIKSQGLIYLPSPTLVEVINTVLINAKIEPLGIKKESGYVIAQVLETKDLDSDKKLVKLNLGNEASYAITKSKSISDNQKVVVAKANTRLNDGSLVKEGNLDNLAINAHICSEKELSISESNDLLMLDDEEEIGKDFFMMEEK